MATARPPGGGSGTPRATIGFDYSALRAAPGVAREAARATAKEISEAFRAVQGEQKIALEQARQVTTNLRQQQAQATAAARSESAQRIATARAESVERQQAARAAANASIEAERRATAEFRAQIRDRQAAQRSSSLNSGSFGQIAGVFGASFGAAQVVKAAIAGEQLATSYRRQQVAAVQLAGSQENLNQLLAAYDEASGGAVDKATALASVTRLMAVGFADNADELKRIVGISRGAAVAMGSTQDYILSQMQLALANQTTARLDQIGVGIEEFQARMDELRQSNSGLSKEMLFQTTLLTLMEEKYGALAASEAAQKTAVEELGTEWGNLGLAVGQATSPMTDFMASGISGWLKNAQRDVKVLTDGWDAMGRAIRGLPNFSLQQPGVPGGWNGAGGWSGGGAFGGGGGGGTGGFDSGGSTRWGRDSAETGLAIQRDAALRSVGQSEAMGIGETRRSSAQQRASTIANYEKQIARDTEDFGRQRANSERKFALSILDVAQDSARQRLKWERDLARNIAQAQADSAERIADARKDSAKRIAELDEDFAKDQKKRQADYRDDVLSAAGRLDAIQLLELRKDRRRELQERKESYAEQRSDLQEQLAERIADENESLAKSIRQQQEAHQRQIDEQAENDALRIQEMKDAFAAEQEEALIQRAIRLERQAQDHEAQLIEINNQQAQRIQQIKTHAQAERDQIDEEFGKALVALGIQVDGVKTEIERITDAAILNAKRYINSIAPVPGHPSLADPYIDRGQPSSRSFVMPQSSPLGMTGTGRTITFNGNVSLSILGTTNMGESQLRPLIREELVNALDQVAGGGGFN